MGFVYRVWVSGSHLYRCATLAPTRDVVEHFALCLVHFVSLCLPVRQAYRRPPPKPNRHADPQNEKKKRMVARTRTRERKTAQAKTPARRQGFRSGLLSVDWQEHRDPFGFEEFHIFAIGRVALNIF